MRWTKNLLIATGALFSLAALASTADANVAKFRVTDVKLQGEKAKVQVTWEYSKSSQNSNYTGKDVKFFLHKSLPGYGNAQNGKPLGTVDMDRGGTGTKTFTFDIKAEGLKPGDAFVVAARWQNGHQWGTDASRQGGEAALPAAAQGLALLTPRRGDNARVKKSSKTQRSQLLKSRTSAKRSTKSKSAPTGKTAAKSQRQVPAKVAKVRAR